jgi:hypothetical protein
MPRQHKTKHGTQRSDQPVGVYDDILKYLKLELATGGAEVARINQ